MIEALLVRRRGLIALTGREITRVLRVWTQTIAAPIASSALFILVFGLSLGDRIDGIHGFDYDVYIVPGLIAMTMAQAAYSNNSSSLFQARFDRFLHDILAAPMRPWEVNLGMSLGGALRALMIGVGLLVVSLVLTDVPIREPGVLLLAVTLSLALFSALGIIVGAYAETWDHTGFVNNLVILPLSFLGGVFYDIGSLPSPWEELSHLNPLAYLVAAVRYGFLGTSEIPVEAALGVTAAIAALLVAWSSRLFATGRRLKP